MSTLSIVDLSEHLAKISPFSESCRLAEVSQLTGEKRLTELNRQALKIQKELDKFRVWVEPV